MAGYTGKVKRLVREIGCHYVKPGKGDHETWWSPVSNQFFTVDSDIKSRHTANETLKQAGMPKQF